MKNISIVIPIYNEEEILYTSVTGLLKVLTQLQARDYEVILVDNGSTDRTPEILTHLARKSPRIKHLSFPFPDFGAAVRLGVETASKDYVVLLNADWWDENFLDNAYRQRKQAEIVLASKELVSRLDKRPFVRKIGTRLLTKLTHFLFDYRGLDTHGLKLLNRKAVLPILRQCTTHEILETELLVRAQRRKLKILELACPVSEIRPARTAFLYRCFNDLKELLLLPKSLKAESLTTPKLFFHADDVGYSTNSVIQTEVICRNKQLSSLSVLVNRPGFIKASFLIRKLKIPTLLHVNLVEGKPVSRLKDIPSLTMANGQFFPLPIFLIRLLTHRIKPEDVQTETTAQLRKLRQAGIQVIGLDSHRHTHMFSPIAEVFENVAEQEKLEKVRSYRFFRTLTIGGDLKRMFVAFLCLGTRLVYWAQCNLPPSWSKASTGEAFAVASWENLHSQNLRQSLTDITLVIHPGLTFDNQTNLLIHCLASIQDAIGKQVIKPTSKISKLSLGETWNRLAWVMRALAWDLQRPWWGLEYFLRSF